MGSIPDSFKEKVTQKKSKHPYYQISNEDPLLICIRGHSQTAFTAMGGGGLWNDNVTE